MEALKKKDKLNNNIQLIVKSKLSKHLLVSLIIQGVYTIITPLSMIFLARFLGPNEFGNFSFAVSFVIIASIFSSLGLPTVVTRYGSIYYIKNNWSKLKGLLLFSNKIVFIVGVIIICFVLIVSKFFEIPSKKYVIIALPIILFLSLSSIRTGLLTAIEKVNLSQLPEMILRPSIFFLVVLVLYYFEILDAFNATISYTIVNGISFLFGVYLVKKFTDKYLVKAKKEKEISLWKKSAFPLLLLGGIQVLGAQADVFLLGLMADSYEVGVFKSMYQISLLVIFSLTAINAVASPYIVRSYEEGQIVKMKKLLIIFCIVNLIFALIISLPFLLFGEYLIGLIYGKEYVVGLSCLYVLILGRIINSIFGVSNQFLKMIGEEKKSTIGIFLGALIGIVLNIILIPVYGILGAAIASTFALIFWNSYLFIFLLRTINALIKKNESPAIN